MTDVSRRLVTAHVELFNEKNELATEADVVYMIYPEDLARQKLNWPGADYLCAMDVFVFPSLYEGMPLSVIEVQCNGLPCIISDTVPEDVFLTDLIRPLSLKSPKENWVRKICGASRHDSQKYGEG